MVLLAVLYLADSITDLDLGYVFQRAAEEAFEVGSVTRALPGGPEPLDLDVLAEHLLEHALNVLLQVPEARPADGAEWRVGIEDSGDGQLLLDLGDLRLRLYVLDGSQGLAGIRVPDLLALGGKDLEEHALTNAV